MYREDIIIPLVTNKDVLDCGGIDHWAMQLKQEKGQWLHAIIAQHAKSVIGVDILEESVIEVNKKKQYKFITGNVEDLPFKQEFEVIVAGEIVEHIYNMGLFLDSAWRSLKTDGVLIITTPNYHAISSIVKSVFWGKESVHPEHTCYYSKKTLSYVVEKHGFEIVMFYFVSRPARSTIIKIIRDLIIYIRPNLAEILVLVAKKLPEQVKYTDKW